LEIEKAIIGMKLVISKNRKKESYLASGDIIYMWTNPKESSSHVFKANVRKHQHESMKMNNELNVPSKGP